MRINRILVSGRLVDKLEQLLPGRLDKELRFVLEDKVTDRDFYWADACVAFKPPVNFQFANLKWVHCLGAGVDSFLFDRPWKDNVVLTRTVGSLGQKISEYCLSYILRDLQLHTATLCAQARKTWEPLKPKIISSQKIVVFGTGEIGQAIARNFGFFDAQVMGVSRRGMEKPGIYFKK